MKKITNLILGALLFVISALQPVSAISLQFDSAIHFEYPRDNFQVTTLSSQEAEIQLADFQKAQITVFPKLQLVEDIRDQYLYKTNIEGIGVALQFGRIDVRVERGKMQLIGPFRNRVPVVAKLVIYKKLPPKEGGYTINSQTIASFKVGTKRTVTNITLGATKIDIKQRTCQLKEKSRDVRLSTVSTKDLAGRGTEVTGGQFQLNLLCDNGVAAYSTFWDQQNPANKSSILTLDQNKSSARGIGLRLYRENEKPVVFGDEWMFSTNEEHPSHLFTVKYVNTSSNGRVSAGSVHAVATVTFSYR